MKRFNFKLLWMVLTMLAVPVVAVSALTTRFGNDYTSGTLKVADGSQNYASIVSPALGSDVTITLPAATGTLSSSASALTSGRVPYATTGGVLTDDAGFAFDSSTNALTVGEASNGGELKLLGNTSGTATLAVAAAAGTPTVTLPTVTWTGPTALPTRTLFSTYSAAGAVSSAPAQLQIYSALSASTAHDGTTAAETTKMPATADGTAATDISAANLTAGQSLHWNVFVAATGDADGDETLTVNVYFGAQLVGTTGAIAVDGPIEFNLDGDVKIRVSGAAGTGIYQCRAFNGSATVAMDGATFGSFDTTAAQAFTIKLDWGGTTDAADTATVEDANLFVNAVD